MAMLGIPMFFLSLYVSQQLNALASVAFILFSMLPYSYFYMVAYRLYGMADRSNGRWKFYLAVVAIQLAVIAGLVALRRSGAAA